MEIEQLRKHYPTVIKEAREWISECQWPDLEPDQVAELSDEQAIAGVRRHFDGGLEEFLRCSMPLDLDFEAWVADFWSIVGK